MQNEHLLLDKLKKYIHYPFKGKNIVKALLNSK
jgi:hypothetical protein